MKNYIIIPTYNEKENIKNIIEQVFELNLNTKVLVIDDNSPDGTGKVADELAKQYNIEVLHRSQKLGLGTAYMAGFKKALDDHADLIYEMDADLSHPVETIPKMMDAIQENRADAVAGSRRIKGGKIEGWGPVRHMISSFGSTFSRIILGLKTKDVTGGFKCYSRPAVQSILDSDINTSGYSFQIETVHHLEKNNFKIVEVPIIFKDRQLGQSKLPKDEIFRFFYTIMKLRFKR